MVDWINRNFEDNDCVGVLKSVRDGPSKSGVKFRLKGDVKGMDLSFVC